MHILQQTEVKICDPKTGGKCHKTARDLHEWNTVQYKSPRSILDVEVENDSAENT
jgi:hypothetical protein